MQATELAALVSQVVELARGTRTSVVINDRLDVAMACGAAGVHLRADSIPAESVRLMAPRGFVIGRSVHSVVEAVAVAAMVDYLIAGTVWPSESKSADNAILGTDALTEIAAGVRVPVLAIGGVTLKRLAEVARTGATGMAAIGLFMAAPSADGAQCRAVRLVETVQAARRRFDTLGSAS